MKASLFLTTLLPLLAAASPLAKRTTSYSGGSTATDVTDGVCGALTVIFARGTGEAGTVGSVIGPGLFNALKSSLNGNVALQGVSYAASAAGNADQGADGGGTMASLAAQALKQCPKTKIALAGYSQGAMVVHNAVTRSGGFPAGSVAAVALFGDPLLRQSVGKVPSSKVFEDCASGDAVCEDGTFSISSAHLSYGKDASKGASFLINTSGVSA